MINITKDSPAVNHVRFNVMAAQIPFPKPPEQQQRSLPPEDYSYRTDRRQARVGEDWRVDLQAIDL